MSEMNHALGLPVPPHTPHAISVSLPTWKDNVGYEEGEKRVIDSMVSGYPRFFIHLSVQKLAGICEQKYATPNERCMLFPTKRIAEDCRSFIQRRSEVLGGLPVKARLVNLFIFPEENGFSKPDTSSSIGSTSVDLHIVLFPSDSFPIAKEFWQHTGFGISSRLAQKCLSILPDPSPSSFDVIQRSTSPHLSRMAGKGHHNRHYSALKSHQTTPLPASTAEAFEELNPDLMYLEERYGRNLPLEAACFAKQALRSRVAGVLRDNAAQCNSNPSKGELVIGPSTRGVEDVSVDDVYLYPSGMSAIWTAHNIALAIRPNARSVCFGFTYTDTLKVLQKWGLGCHFFGFGLDSDIDELERTLEAEHKLDPSKPPVLALFAEFPSNPLLRSANMPRLRQLADKYDFLIVIDETIGNFVNVEVLPYADIVVSSLTKVFSGASNVMGGSLTLNPRGCHYSELKAHMTATFEDVYFDEDAIYMERNSRDFKHRIRIIDANAEAVCDFLRSRSLAAAAGEAPLSPSPAIKEVFYPKYITRANYDQCRIQHANHQGGFGGLFSLTFTSSAASKAFFDELPCYKGPSLGTNFTLACPYTILAHYAELEWAAGYGVEEGLVRVSVGMEDTAMLLRSFEKAIDAAENADAE